MDNNERFSRMEDKLDQVVEKISSIDTTLAKQEVSLSDHIRRTQILEEKLEPVERHVSMVNGIVKFLMLLSGVATIVAAVLAAVK